MIHKFLFFILFALPVSGRILTVHNNCSTVVSWAIKGTRGMLVTTSSRSLQPGERSPPIILWHGSGASLWNNSTQSHANTLAEFYIDDEKGDYYCINIVDGFDLGLRITPSVDHCSTIQCTFDAAACPGEMVEYAGGSCLSACTKFASAEFCCTENHHTPDTCPANNVSRYFKTLCSDAYTYIFDDPTSIRTCADALSYGLTFCPAPDP
jgi:hypothetical protein